MKLKDQKLLNYQKDISEAEQKYSNKENLLKKDL